MVLTPSVDRKTADRVGAMFDRIARRYDLLNRLLSARRDVAWRSLAAHLIRARGAREVLDVATGTADLLMEICREPSLRGVGVDIAERMLEVGRDKVAAAGMASRLTLQSGDAMALPFEAAQFDAVTIAFGIRNVSDVSQALGEMYRVLRPGGSLAVLEFSIPSGALFRRLYLWYFRRILPLIGSVISGDRHAYLYLNRTVESFPYGAAFEALMRGAGFGRVVALPLTFGIASLYLGTKAA